MDVTDDRLRWEYQFMDDPDVEWTRVYAGNVKFGPTSTMGTLICRRTIIQGRACVYNMGTIDDIRMGHDVWWFMETTSVWTERSRNIEN